MVEISKSGSGEGPGKVTTRGYSTPRFRGQVTALGVPETRRWARQIKTFGSLVTEKRISHLTL